MSAPTDDDWLQRLTGVRSSKPTYYSEYRRLGAGLRRAIRAWEAVSSALSRTATGPHDLAAAVVTAAARELDAAWVVLGLRAEAFPGSPPPLTAATRDGRVVTDPAALPLQLRRYVAPVPSPPAADDPGVVVVPLVRSDALTRDRALVGTLVVWLDAGAATDDSDLQILGALAAQAGIAVENACLYQEVARHAGDLQRRNDELQRVQRRLLQAREHRLISDERARIARELHDSVAQHLVSIGLHLEWCRPLCPTGSPVEERLTLSKELARAAVEHIRTAIFELSAFDDPAPGGLRAALDDLAVNLARSGDLEIGVRVARTLPRLPLAVEHALFRIAQEALFNVTRHAQATHAAVAVTNGNGRVRLSISDDGRGDAAALRHALRAAEHGDGPGFHRGLANMAARAREAGGELRLLRSRGGGVRVVAEVAAPYALQP